MSCYYQIMSEQNNNEQKCSRCGNDIGAVIIFDSSVGDSEFCEDCHREDMRQHRERMSKKEHLK